MYIVSPPSVLWILFKCFYRTIIPAACMRLFYDSLQFVGPQLLKYVHYLPVIVPIPPNISCRQLIYFVGDPTQPLWRGILYAAVMFLVAEVQSMSLHQYFVRIVRSGMNMRTVLTSAIFNKVRIWGARY